MPKHINRKRPRKGTPQVPAKAKELLAAEKPIFELRTKDGERCIHCFVCDMTSFGPKDVAYKFCGNCKIFFEDVMRAYAVLKHIGRA